ncbi:MULTISPECIES: M20 family metallopeptidase [Aminobacterium]|uniref:M20 family metallopeptidase n=1 Tax=Aminobacterium TaxID=81466 RepID=UPI0025801E95|nr:MULTISPECIES: M20 family metallopeptidase [unclassified Aminobacterium]
MYKDVLRFFDEEGLVKCTQNLVRINSVFDPDVEGANESRVTEYLEKLLHKEGFEVHVDEVIPGRSNVIAFLRGKEPGKTLLFEGHQDVVSIGDPQKWKYDPFGGEIVEVDGKKRMYGRGTNDTKGNTAAAFFAAKTIKDSGIPFKGNILLCFPVDEEGSMIGIKDFIEKGWADDVDGAIICEPEEKNLCIFQKGAMRIKVTFQGAQAHGCMPLSGVNPNWALMRFINEIKHLENFEKDRVMRHDYLGWPSITPTMIKAPLEGVAQINVIPDDCYVTLDIRTVPNQDHEALVRQIQGIIDRLSRQYPDDYDRFAASIEIIDDRPWTEVPKEEPVVKAVDFAFREVMGSEPKYNGVPGATDGTFLQIRKGIPVIVTGAGDREVPHHVDEWVELDDLIEAGKIYTLAALYYLNE